jgi:hypothetical protein
MQPASTKQWSTDQMKHDPQLSRARAWQLEAAARRRREARQVAIAAFVAALALGAGMHVAMDHGKAGLAAVLALCATLALIFGVFAASEA